jgi:hypothetical protein
MRSCSILVFGIADAISTSPIIAMRSVYVPDTPHANGAPPDGTDCPRQTRLAYARLLGSRWRPAQQTWPDISQAEDKHMNTKGKQRVQPQELHSLNSPDLVDNVGVMYEL